MCLAAPLLADRFLRLLWRSSKKLVGQGIGLLFEAGLSRIPALFQIPPQRPGIFHRCQEYACHDSQQGEPETERDEPWHGEIRHRRSHFGYVQGLARTSACLFLHRAG